MQIIEAIPNTVISNWETENIHIQDLEYMDFTDSLFDYLNANVNSIDESMGLRTTIDGENLSTNYIHTNGEWIWRCSIVYYMFQCNVPVPRVFADSIRKDNFKMPFLAEDSIPTRKEYFNFSKKTASTFYILTWEKLKSFYWVKATSPIIR